MSELDMTHKDQPFAGWSMLEKTLGGLSIVLLVMMTLLTCTDVVARWFNAPISGAFELTQLMLAALIYAALPLTTKAGEHVEVELFSMLVGKIGDFIFHVIAHVITVIILFIIGWRLWEHALRLAHDGAVTNSLGLPFAPIGYFASVSCFLSGLIALIALFRWNNTKNPE